MPKKTFPILFLFAGSIILIIGSSKLWDAHKSSTWESTPGIITSSKIEDELTSDSTVVFHARINYAYEVNGKKYDGTRISFGDFSSSSSERPFEITQRYSLGKKVDVYFNPENPKDSLLLPGIQPQTYFTTYFALVFLLFGALILFAQSRSPSM